MLRKIILILTKAYKEKIQDTFLLEKFSNDMQRHGTDMEWYSADDYGTYTASNENTEWNDMGRKEKLYISDDKCVLNDLQNAGYFTIALYHEDVDGLLSGTQYAIEGLTEIDWDFLNKVYQRYCHIPWHITETKRCLIREMGQEDLDDLYELYKDPEVTRYTEALFQDKKQEKQYINDYIENIYKYYGFGTWLIHRKEDGKLIGRAGFNYRPGYEEAELGFVIGYPYWRNGYAYEVCRHLLQIGKKVYEFEKVQALVDERNEASIALLKKLGFFYKEEIVLDGQKLSRYLYI